MVSKRQRVILVVAVVVVLMPLAALGMLLFPPDFMYSHYSSYAYTTSISTNTTIENVTVFLPFPAGTDGGSDPVSELWIYDDTGTQVTDWEAAVVQTPHGPMLRLHADQLVGEDRYVLWTYAPNGSVIDRQEIGPDEIPANMTNRELVRDPTRYSIAWQTTVEHDIETRYPVGNASFIVPANDVAATSCQDPWSETDTCFTFTSVIGTTYEADQTATVTVGEIRFEGWNEWGFWLANSFNTFEATTSPAVFTDDQQGWVSVDGQLHGGMGRYDGPAR